MEDKRTLWALFLIIIVVMVYSEAVLAPYAKKPEALQTQNTQPVSTVSNGTLPAESPQPPASASSSSVSTTPGQTPANIESAPTAAELKASSVTEIETDEFIAKISHLGARLISLELKKYTTHLDSPQLLNLVSVGEMTPLPLGIYSGPASDQRTKYQLISPTPTAEGQNIHYDLKPGQEIRLAFNGQLSDGREITKSMVFKGGSYSILVDAKLSQAAADGSNLWLEWPQYVPTLTQQDRTSLKRFTLLTENGKIRHVSQTEASEGFTDPEPARWGAIDEVYFIAALIPGPEIHGPDIRIGKDHNNLLIRVRGNDTQGSFTLYSGPKSYEVLESAGFDLQRSVDLGFFSFLAYPLLLGLKLFYRLVGNYGLAIVLLTLVIKSLFFPLTKASLKSMKAMQALQPEVTALRERIKDPNQLNREVLGLYKKHGVNPMGGCLPIMIQIPVFFGLYQALGNAIELRHSPFALWIRDLSAPEHLTIFGINCPIMILIMGVTMFLQQYTSPSPSMDPSQRKTMLIMTIIFPLSFLIYPFPAGLALYMLVNTAISLVQQMYLRNDNKANPFLANFLASMGIFIVAFILTKL